MTGPAPEQVVFELQKRNEKGKKLGLIGPVLARFSKNNNPFIIQLRKGLQQVRYVKSPTHLGEDPG